MDYELVLMAHRYLYYVLGEPVISDYLYDPWEREARQVLPEDSPIHGVVSSNPWSYSKEQIEYARKLSEEA